MRTTSGMAHVLKRSVSLGVAAVILAACSDLPVVAPGHPAGPTGGGLVQTSSRSTTIAAPLGAVPEGSIPDGGARASSHGLRAPSAPSFALIPGMPDLQATCGRTAIGIAYDGTYYYVAEGGWTNMCIDRYTAAGAYVDSKRFPPDFRGLHYVPATGKLVGRTFGGWGGQLFAIDYAAGTSTQLTSYNVCPGDAQEQPAADPDGATYWIWDVQCGGNNGNLERHRISDNALVQSFHVGGTATGVGSAIGVSASAVYVPNGSSVSIYSKATGALLQSQGLGSSTLGCWGYGFGVSADGSRVGFDVNCGAVRAEALASLDNTPPVIAPEIIGSLGSNGWYVSDVNLTWSVTDPESAISSEAGCGASSVTTDTQDASFTCTATSAGGTASKSVVIKRDATRPVIAWAGNAGNYTVDQSISITCSATDATSGVASSTCTSISGDAYTFGLGSHTYTASATDNAGNRGTASTTFTVNVTYASLCHLAERWSRNAGVANSLCQKLSNASQAAARGDAGAASNIVNAFVNEVAAQSGKTLPSDTAGILTSLAQAL